MNSPRYTHGHAESVLRSHRWRTAQNSCGYLLPYLREGMTVLDIGAGPGTITADLAHLVAPGRVTALEISEGALDLSRAELAGRGIDADYLVGDVHHLDLADDSFDIVHAHQVLQHVVDPVQALREIRRICRPDGLVAIRESDYHGFVWYPESALLDRWMDLYQTVARGNGGEPDAGRRLLAWAHQAGFSHVTASTSTWCHAGSADREHWGGMWADRILSSDLARQSVDDGHATRGDLEQIAEAWQTWAANTDGWISILHGEILARP